jgi:hypothetical protein
MKTQAESMRLPMTFWETAAQSQWGSYISGIERRAIEKADLSAQTRTTALEIGCEGGRWSKLLSSRGWKMVCTAIDPEALGICRARIPAARCVLVRPGDVKLPCESASIGLMLCIEVSQALPYSDWFIGEARRVLCDGGLCVPKTAI